MKGWRRKLTFVGLSLVLFTSISFSPAVLAGEENRYSFLTKNEKHPVQNNHALSDNTLIVKYSQPLTAKDHMKAGTNLVSQISELKYVIVKVNNKMNLQKALHYYKQLGNVIYAERSATYSTLSTLDPKINEQFHLSLLNIAKAQKLAGKHEIKVAIIDQGIDMNHPELQGKLLPGYNVLDPMNPPLPDYHGTHVAGILASIKGNGIGGYGINPNVKILPIDVFGRSPGTSDYTIAQGVLYAIKQKVKVINLSLGSVIPSPILEDAINKALKNNIIVIAASGNNGNDRKVYPAAYERVISVGAIDNEKKITSFSSFGPSLDLVAPGEKIYAPIYELEKKSSFRSLSGTSMASSIVTGVTTLLLSKYPNLTPEDVEYILKATAIDLGEAGFDHKYGNGLIHPEKVLQFNIDTLPTVIKKNYSNLAISKIAKEVLQKDVHINDQLSKPYEQAWYQLKAEKDEYIQINLEGSKQYDLELMVKVVAGTEEQSIHINNVGAAKAEGKLYQVPFSGKVYIGVKDANGSFDFTRKTPSYFKIHLKHVKTLPKDETTLNQPLIIENLPYSGKETFTSSEAEEDNDYFKLQVPKEQLVKIDVSALPGINPNISVYNANQVEIVAKDQDSYESNVKEELVSSESDSSITPLFYANFKGLGEGETLSFRAIPEIDYYIKVSNKNEQNHDSFLYGYHHNHTNHNVSSTESSILPYEISVKAIVMPEDEDSYPVNIDSYSGEEEQSIETMLGMFENPIFNIEASAREYFMNKSTSGYLQSYYDEDWFQVRPEKTGIYSIYFSNEPVRLPILEIYKVGKELDFNGEFTPYLEPVDSNIDFDSSSPELKKSFFAGLKKNDTYFIKITSNYFTNEHVLDRYEFSSKLIVQDPEDYYEQTVDGIDAIVDLPGKELYGNFAIPNDKDTYYLKATKDEIYSLSIVREKKDPYMTSLYPSELFKPFQTTALVIEDVNKNRVIDEAENMYMQPVTKITSDGSTIGSFKVTNNSNYFIVLTGRMESSPPFSLLPYKLKLSSVHKKDESSSLQSATPLKKNNFSEWINTGSLQSVPFGDKDYFSFQTQKDGQVNIKFTHSTEIDGVIHVYHQGKKIFTSDMYPEGDEEIATLTLPKGKYVMEIKDIYGRASVIPYTVKVTMMP